MGRSHDLETVLRSARELERDGGIHFLFVGEGAKKDWLRRESARLSNVTVIDPLPRAERDTVLAACDLSLIPFVPGMSGVSVPSRMYNVMASGRPLLALCDRGSEIGMVIREERIGWVVDCGDTAGLAEAIRFSAGAPVLLAELGVRARSAAERKYSEDRVLDRWEAAMRELDGEVAAPAQKVA